MSDQTSLDTYLTSREENYSPKLALVGTAWHGPGYHTRIPDGTWAHPTRDSLEYAVALLMAGSPAYVERAQAVIRRILSLQDTDPTSPTYGIWSWLYEEPLDAMRPPDWNWADFLGALLCHIALEHHTRLSAPLVADVRTALGHAAWSIFRRNVQPDYTNIAIMGAAVTGVAGEILAEPRLLAYARQRLHNILDFVQANGGLTEYNSPTYTPVALFETERILQLATDPLLRQDAEALRRFIWETIATHYHPGTAQWAGPHSRAYSDYLTPFVAREIARRTSVPIPLHPRADETTLQFTPVQPVACPPELVSRFLQIDSPPIFQKTTFTQARTLRGRTYRDTTGFTWMVPDAILSSINYDSLWTQRHTLLGYWRTDHDPAVVLRLRCLRDGQDFASAGVMNRQQGPRILSLVSFIPDMGDFHLHLDKPGDGRFRAKTLGVRYSLRGSGVHARQIDAATFELSAGDWRAVVHTVPARFGERDVRWQLVVDESEVGLEAVLHAGNDLSFRVADYADFKLAAGLELLSGKATALPESPQITIAADDVQVDWDTAGLMLNAPAGLWPRP